MVNAVQNGLSLQLVLESVTDQSNLKTKLFSVLGRDICVTLNIVVVILHLIEICFLDEISRRDC